MTFVDVASFSINLDHVTVIHHTSRGNIIFEFDVLDGDNPYTLTLYGEEAEAFQTAWDNSLASTDANLHIYRAD